jgi:hypothetical protein
VPRESITFLACIMHASQLHPLLDSKNTPYPRVCSELPLVTARGSTMGSPLVQVFHSSVFVDIRKCKSVTQMVFDGAKSTLVTCEWGEMHNESTVNVLCQSVLFAGKSFVRLTSHHPPLVLTFVSSLEDKILMQEVLYNPQYEDILRKMTMFSQEAIRNTFLNKPIVVENRPLECIRYQ